MLGCIEWLHWHCLNSWEFFPYFLFYVVIEIQKNSKNCSSGIQDFQLKTNLQFFTLRLTCAEFLREKQSFS